MLHCPRNMMMRTVAYCGFFLAICFTPALAADPTGDWKVADGVANIRVAECNGSMWGAVSWEKTPGGRDKSNPAAPQATAATAPKTTAPVNPAPKAASGQKLQATAQPADTVGDICLLPDIARFTH